MIRDSKIWKTYPSTFTVERPLPVPSTNLRSILIPCTRSQRAHTIDRNDSRCLVSATVQHTGLPWEIWHFYIAYTLNAHALLNSLRWYTSDLRQPSTIKDTRNESLRRGFTVHQPSKPRPYSSQTSVSSTVSLLIRLEHVHTLVLCKSQPVCVCRSSDHDEIFLVECFLGHGLCKWIFR